MSTLVELYEMHARDCVQSAERTDDPKDRELLLKMACDWLKEADALQQRADRRRRKPVRPGHRRIIGDRPRATSNIHMVCEDTAPRNSHRKDSTYRSGRSRDWLKFKNPNAPAVKREAEEEWGR